MMPNAYESVPVLQQCHTLLANPALLVVVTDVRGIIQTLGVGAKKSLDYSTEELSGQLMNARLYDKFDVRQRAKELSKKLNQDLKPGFAVLTKELDRPVIHHWLKKGKGRLATRCTVSEISCHESGWKGYVFVGVAFNEVEQLSKQVAELQTKLAVANAKLAGLSVTDELTGLKNNSAFEERLNLEFHRTLRHHSPLSVMLLSWKGYEQCLAESGPEVSHTMLRVMADAQLRENRSTDFLAHLGGGVMAYVLPETDTQGASIKAARVTKLLSGLNGTAGSVEIGIGIASVTEESPAVHGVTKATTLVQRARVALEVASCTVESHTVHFSEQSQG
ncbi:MAG: diguanylate cyclase [Pseudomonadota bacterium]